MQVRKLHAALAVVHSLLTAQVLAELSKGLPIPSGSPSAKEIADQVYFVNHFYALKNFGITNDNNDPKKSRNAKPGRISVLVNKSAEKQPCVRSKDKNHTGEHARCAPDNKIG